ncbi:cardiolipin synthase [Aquibacillus sp. 3ASR75-11]|uniref:Cardiolipin synthase n=1 Tax=Terrihalobacillus insolitus TaxID=2950438 RepID=A0A9X3WT95_9BACI|nr:cardiolipin synthase [Terrihalobacillus insolitus]MDC3414957.1 cardiolipin synthase [Terrihalobacillus insolitus]MDC3425070.1 cardiolipin synthase [Terrihalobacillus insolitus]
MAILFIVSSLVLFILLLWLDFRLGKKAATKSISALDFSRKQGDYSLFSDGNKLFDQFFQDIMEAQKKIDVQFYIVRNDEVSKTLFDLLKERAKNGVQVRLLIDRIGGLKVRKKIANDLRDAGVNVMFSDKPRFPYYFYKLNRRNHRKIAVVDHKIGYVGGFNIGKEYLGKDAYFGPWRDYHLRLTGEIVQDLAFLFQHDWKENMSGTPSIPKDENGSTNEGTSHIKLSATETGQLEDILVNRVNQAHSEILLASPYFIPTQRLFEAFVQAIKRGVEVTLVAPLKGDHPFVKPASIPYYRELSNAGGHVYLYDKGFYHAKVMIVDQELCEIGTANLDQRSLFLNKEVSAVFTDSDTFIHEIRSSFIQDRNASIPLTENGLKKRSFSSKISGVLAKCIKPLL